LLYNTPSKKNEYPVYLRDTIPKNGRIMDRLEAMSLFTKVVECGSLSAASRKLNVPLATVSRNLSELESYLKTKLLHRTTRRLELTDSGRIYYVSCQRLLDELTEIERVTTGEYVAPKGNLTITAPVVFGRLYFIPIIADFLKAYPEIDIRLILSDQIVDLMENRIDIALRIGRLSDSPMIAKSVGLIRKVVCASPTYFKVMGLPKLPEDLLQHTCITFDRLGEPSHWIFQKGRTRKVISVHSRLIVSTSEAAMDAAISGLGITRVLSYQAAEHVAKGKLILVLPEHDSNTIPANLVYFGGKTVPLKMRAFLDFTIPRLKKELPQEH
jgi:DNA-binding transcriptional LysR family regulator